jgi:hypothetical protein
VKFSGVDRTLAARMYDDLIGTFTRNGTVDEETQNNDLSIIRQMADAPDQSSVASLRSTTEHRIKFVVLISARSCTCRLG